MATIIQEDAPHPDSYRPDLPLRSDMFTSDDDAVQDAYDEGFAEGQSYVAPRLRTELADAKEKVAELTARLATIGATEK